LPAFQGEHFGKELLLLAANKWPVRGIKLYSKQVLFRSKTENFSVLLLKLRKLYSNSVNMCC